MHGRAQGHGLVASDLALTRPGAAAPSSADSSESAEVLIAHPFLVSDGPLLRVFFWLRVWGRGFVWLRIPGAARSALRQVAPVRRFASPGAGLVPRWSAVGFGECGLRGNEPRLCLRVGWAGLGPALSGTLRSPAHATPTLGGG